MPLAGTGETTVLNALLAGRYLSLHTGLPPSSEISTSGSGYARQPVTFAQASGPDPTVYKNTVAVQTNPALTDWGFINYFGVWTALTGGSLLAYAALDTGKQVAIGDVVRWEINALSVDAN